MSDVLASLNEAVPRVLEALTERTEVPDLCQSCVNPRLTACDTGIQEILQDARAVLVT